MQERFTTLIGKPSTPKQPLEVSFSFLTLPDTPGPGTYRLPSDFGHYESKVKYEEGKKLAKSHSQGFFGGRKTAQATLSPRENNRDQL